MQASEHTKLLRRNGDVLMPEQPSKDQKSRLRFYIEWLSAAGREWYHPDLRAYRDYLLHERTRIGKGGQRVSATLAPRTVVAHLATIRARYAELLLSSDVHDDLIDLGGLAGEDDVDGRRAREMADMFLVRLQKDVHPAAAPVKLVEAQDLADSEHLRLKPWQVGALARAPGISTLRGLRDTALMTLMVCSGIRAAEAAALQVDDLRQQLGGELSLRVREGKGGKQRLIPYGPLDWCLMYVDAWLREAAIKAGPVFRGIRRGGKAVRARGIGTWTVNDIMNSYPISIEGALRLVKPHDLRRTYARNAYDYGMDLERIRQNLGHTSLGTTQTYIGELDGPRSASAEYVQPAARSGEFGAADRRGAWLESGSWQLSAGWGFVGGDFELDGLLDQLTELGLGQGAGLHEDDFALLEDGDGGDAADLKGLAEGGVGVGIDLDHADLPGEFGGQLLQNGADHAAGTAPLGPEIDQHGQLVRGENGFRLKSGIGDIKRLVEGGRGLLFIFQPLTLGRRQVGGDGVFELADVIGQVAGPGARTPKALLAAVEPDQQ